MAQKTRIPVVSCFIPKGTAFHRKDLINAFVKLIIVMQLIRPDTELFDRLERLDTTFHEDSYITAPPPFQNKSNKN